MSWLKFTSTMLVLITGLASQITGQTVSKPEPNRMATVSGRVVLNGEPMRGIRVMLLPVEMDYSSNQSLSLRAISDGNGRFLITGIKAGRYYLMALAPGPIMQKDPASFRGRGRLLNLAEGENVEGEDLSLIRSGVITGRVTDLQGKPAVEERIILSRLDSRGRAEPYQFGTNPDMYQTDDRGVYRIYGLPPGRYLISAGYVAQEGSISYPTPKQYYPRTFHPNVTDESQAEAIELAEGAESTGVDIVLAEHRRSFDIYGRVVNADSGEPMAGVVLSYGVPSMQSQNITHQGSSSERSEPTGSFRLANVTPGRYAVFVLPSGESDFFSDPTMCEVNDRDLHDVEVRARQGGAISGVISVEGKNDRSVPDMLKQIYLSYTTFAPGQWDLPRGHVGRIDPDGRFSIRAVLPGKVRIIVSPNGDLRGLMLSRIELNGVSYRDGFEIAAGQQVTGVRLVFTYGTLTLHGQLKIAGGPLPAGIRWFILAERPDQPRQSFQLGSEVDARGEFTLEHLSPGEYELKAVPTGGVSPQLLSAILSFKERVVVTGNNPPITVMLDLRDKGHEK